ncbi:amidohydrolase [Micromonospora sp. NPDC048830]|uniref:amidohydrolase n=1 Tax=Micromonospora sp. NPDC048830 TaxID=3364257 RepID=UPI0037246899
MNITPGSMIISSRRILTMDATDTVVEGSVVIRDGRISQVLPAGAALPADLAVTDVGDRPVLPGFVDPHVHIEMAATAMWGAVDCHAPPCGSIEELIEQLRAHAHLREQRGGWLVGQGGLFAGRRFAEQRLPTREDLDRVSTTFPVVVRFGAHVTVVNSHALSLVDVDSLPETGDAYIGRDASGRPNGELHELFYALPIPAMTDAELSEAIEETAERYLTRYGVTTAGEITNSMPGVRRLSELAGTGRLPASVDAFVWAPGTLSLEELFAQRRAGQLDDPVNPGFRYRGIKIFVDGGFSAAGAAVLRPYAQLRGGVPQSGRMAYTVNDLTDLIRTTDDLGLQLTAHVNGERAQRELCRAAVHARGGTTGHLPVRLEHAGNVLTDDATLEHWHRAGAVPVPQAGFIYTMGSFIPESMGKYALPAMFRFRDLIDRGWRICSSSDGAGSELLQFNPLFGVQCAVTRRSCISEEVNPDQRITVLEALAMHTSSAAAAMGLADRGSIEAGKRADLVVLASDPRDVAPEVISTIAVDTVTVNGTVVRRYR